MAGMALPSVLRLLILSTLAFDWYGAAAAAAVVRAVEDGEYPRRTVLYHFLGARLEKLMKRCSCGTT